MVVAEKNLRLSTAMRTSDTSCSVPQTALGIYLVSRDPAYVPE